MTSACPVIRCTRCGVNVLVKKLGDPKRCTDEKCPLKPKE